MGLAQAQAAYTGQEETLGTEVCCQVTLGLGGDGECQGGQMVLEQCCHNYLVQFDCIQKVLENMSNSEYI